MFKTLRLALDSKLFLSLFLIASPWIILFVSTGLITHHSIFSLVPVWSDELSYWHEILSLSQKGIHHGYYAYNEVIPAISTFGPHGFGTVSIYALFAKLFGWKAFSMPLANAFFMSLAFLSLVLMLKPRPKLIAIILLFTVSYTPYLLFSITSMSEGLNYALLTVYFVILYALIQRGTKGLLYAFVVFCTAISFVRIIYIVLFLPLFFIRDNELNFNRKSLLYFISGTFFCGILFVITTWFVSPYPDSFLHDLFNLNGISPKLSFFLVHLKDNLLNFSNPISDNFIQAAERYFVLLVLIYSLVKSNILQYKFKNLKIRYFVVFLILFSVLSITLCAYDVFDWRDYRVLAPVLYGCVLFLILNSDSTDWIGIFAINTVILLILVYSTPVLESFTIGRYNKPIQSNVMNRIEYSAKAGSPFENTIDIQLLSPNIVLNIPAGIGISTVAGFSDKLQAKYVFSQKEINLTTYKLIDFDKLGYLYKRSKIVEP
ncbi:MAG: hypothetical protein WCG08_13610 [Paludibacter sp.]